MLAMIKRLDEEEFEARHFIARHTGPSIKDAQSLGNVVRIKAVSPCGLQIACADLLKQPLQAGRFYVHKSGMNRLKCGAGGLNDPN